jgi:hypothetical protein
MIGLPALRSEPEIPPRLNSRSTMMRIPFRPSTQIPVAGYAPEPLLRVDVVGATHATLTAAAFKALADSLWSGGSMNGSGRAFNVVISGSGHGAVLRGFAWNKDENTFGLRAGDKPPAGHGLKVDVIGALAPLVTIQGSVDTSTFNLSSDFHLFVYGTGFSSKIVDGRFSLPAIPMDKYEGFLISLPKPDHPASETDSASVYSLNSLLQDGAVNLPKGPIHDRLPLPDSLLTH